MHIDYEEQRRRNVHIWAHGHGILCEAKPILQPDFSMTQELNHELIRIEWFPAWVMGWFESIPEKSIWAVSWTGSFPAEATWVASWIKHYSRRISHHSKGFKIENVIWVQIKSNELLTSIQLGVESWVGSDSYVCLLLESRIVSNQFQGKPLRSWVQLIHFR